MAGVLYSFHRRQLARTRPASFRRLACKHAATSQKRMLCFRVMACRTVAAHACQSTGGIWWGPFLKPQRAKE